MKEFAFKSLLLIIFMLVVAACGDTSSEKDTENKVSDQVSADTEAASEPADKTDVQISQEMEATSGFKGDIIYGSADAPVEIIEYASLTCGACQYFHTTILPDIKEKLIDTGKVRLHFRHLIRDRLDLAASSVVRCSGETASRKLLERFFSRQSEWIQSDDQVGALATIARGVGMSRTDFDRCLQDRDMHVHLVEMTEEGRKKGVTGTPTVFVNDKVLDNYSLENIEKAVEDAL